MTTNDAAPPVVEQAVLDDLRARLRAWRPVELTGDHGWERGTDPGYLADLVSTWAEDYDWREHEQRIRALPWALAGGLRVVHQRAADPDAPPSSCCTAGPTRCCATSGCCRC
ncbi:epoxide hydrolase N-terminal domain-containing protein [Blastococcus brunescens]|uniref:Epoxide hydrolase N-terminal domain-containing protein n=1 Tax=Blastococcus brunescens TaxID=1564165 RepID=A0ABZ1AUQ2_9ACTN|nr:epoxide hydrolase N-terminal domain-containing protein [Blastococcus sp. BMG 8361]WRL62174.1 epoxide hydrolase N-terminal domain-containing protein [Blastococcus sp. BMG 8361]